METKTALWFCIEEAFAQIFDLCVEARAAELVVTQKSAEERLVRSFATGGLPAELVPRSEEEGRYARAAELARDLAFREAHATGPDLVGLRSQLRRLLSELRGKLSEVLTEHEVYYVLFPIVVYSDELVACATRGASRRWEPMQGEFYEIDNGGEAFYEVLDERLKQDETHPLVFETFYFCLSDGFTGMYPPGSKKIEDHKARIRARLPNPEIHFPSVRREPRRAELVAFPWRYYAAAAGGIVIVYTVLSWAAGS
jgi:type IV/VI secretion system ImpK/VasF family protein